jgi:hypothetical protein
LSFLDRAEHVSGLEGAPPLRRVTVLVRALN